MVYEKSGFYTARFTVVDSSGNSNSDDINIIIYINESEADEIAIPIYELFDLAPGGFNYDVNEFILKV